MNSIRKHLLKRLVLLLTIVALGSAGLSYWQAQSETNDFLDHQLRQVALGVGDGPPFRTGLDTINSTGDPEDDIIIQVWNADKKMVRTSHPDITMPVQADSGYFNLVLQGEAWRGYQIQKPDYIIQVSQRLVVREELGADAAMRAAIPVLLLIPLIWLIAGWSIQSAFNPLRAIVHQVRVRDPNSIETLSISGVPAEVLPLAFSINGLLERIQKSRTLERRFIADAAHGLRTPLTALQLQVESLKKAIAPHERDQAIVRLQEGLHRTSKLARQLLTLARLEAAQVPDVAHSLSFNDLVKSCLAELLPLAEEKEIDLGMERNMPAEITGQVHDLGIALTNLLDNAIRYTPSGGRIDIDLSVKDSIACLRITDTGPGIKDSEIPNLFAPFFHPAGAPADSNGLGLAISRTIFEQHGGRIIVTNRTDAPGLSVSVCLPLTLTS